MYAGLQKAIVNDIKANVYTQQLTSFNFYATEEKRTGSIGACAS